MNYLAHSYLSGPNEGVIVGNFIGDFVKGNAFNTFPEDIKKGILLHRAIDSFTDNSPIVRKSKSYFQPSYGKYSGIIIDLVYDHFLSCHWNTYSNFSREDFIQNIYTIVSKYHPIFPPRAKRLVPSIIHHNWMRYYASFYGLEKVIQRMSIRTSLPQETTACIQILKENYDELDEQFLLFFKEICEKVKNAGIENLTFKTNHESPYPTR